MGEKQFPYIGHLRKERIGLGLKIMDIVEAGVEMGLVVIGTNRPILKHGQINRAETKFALTPTVATLLADVLNGIVRKHAPNALPRYSAELLHQWTVEDAEIFAKLYPDIAEARKAKRLKKLEIYRQQKAPGLIVPERIRMG